MKNNYSSPGGGLLHAYKGSRIYNNKWFLFLMIIVFTAGCKKVHEEAGLSGVCPIVISTTPVNTATGVSVSTNIDATFNEVMDPATINALTFKLAKGTTPIAGVISYSGVTASFIPTTGLTPNTEYTATVAAGVKDPAGNAMINDHVWTFTTGPGPDVTAPVVTSTDPVNAAIGVAFNKKISATFSEAMDSLSTTTSFTISNTSQGGTAVTGMVSYSGTTSVFTPLFDLSPNTTYTATITTGAKDLAGNALAGNYTWSFTTGAAADVTSPIVVSTVPANGATGVAINTNVYAMFSEAMAPSTINITSFTLKQGTTPIDGNVSYAGVTATFSPLANLAANTTYTATITTDAKDLAGNALQNNYVWSFTTVQTLIVVPPPVLGSASLFGAFGGSAGITNQGLNTVINNGGIGTTGASTLITGFHDGLTGDIYTETPLNVGLVTKGIYTAPPAPGTATSFAIATDALADALVAYNSISPASKPGGTDPGAGELGGLTLAPGTYKSASGTFKITNGNLVLDAKGDPNAVWIFQTAAGLTVGVAGPSGARSVQLINGALAKNVYWYVGSAATINAAGGGIMTGNIIASAGVTFSTAGNAVQTVLNGRALSLNASVTMVNTTINVPN